MLPNGSERWMARRGKVQLDADGKAIFVSGLLIDITAAESCAERASRTQRAALPRDRRIHRLRGVDMRSARPRTSMRANRFCG